MLPILYTQSLVSFSFLFEFSLSLLLKSSFYFLLACYVRMILVKTHTDSGAYTEFYSACGSNVNLPQALFCRPISIAMVTPIELTLTPVDVSMSANFLLLFVFLSVNFPF